MPRKTLALLASFLLTSLLGLAGLAMAAEFSADMLVQSMGQNLTGKIYIKNQKQRMEMGGAHGMITIFDLATKKSYMLMPATKMAMEMGEMDEKTHDALGMELDKLPPGAKLVGSETVNGYPCDVYTFQDPEEGSGKAWIAKKLKYVMKAEGKNDQGEFKMELKNVKEGGVADALFAIPPDYQRMQVPGMMQQMQQQMQPQAPAAPKKK